MTMVMLTTTTTQAMVRVRMPGRSGFANSFWKLARPGEPRG